MERGALAGRDLHVQQWGHLVAATRGRLGIHEQQREVSSAAADRAGVEPAELEDGVPRGLWDVQRTAGCAGISHGSECAVQSDVQRGIAAGGETAAGSSRAVAAESAAGAGWSAARSEDTDADLVVAASAAGTFPKHCADAGVCGVAWVPRDCRSRCEPAVPDHLPGGA